jgi:hypothetical protein
LGLSKTTWRVLGVLAALALLGLSVYTWRGAERDQAAADAAKSAGGSLGKASAGSGLSIDELIARGNAAPGIQAAIDRSKPRPVAVCGRGTVSIPADEFLPRDLMAEFGARSFTQTKQIALVLSQRSDAMSRAVGLRFQTIYEIEERRMARGRTCMVEPCESDPWMPASLDALVSLAQDSADARAHRQALFSCEKYTRHQGCATLSWQRFTELAPESVEGWLFLAAARLRANDPQGAQQAMERAANAPDARSGLFDLQRTALPVVEALPEGFERAAAVAALTGVFAAEALPSLTVAAQFCGAKAVQNPERAALCTQLAQRFQASDALVYYGLGARLLQRLARTPEQARAIEQERDALYSTLKDFTPSGPDDGVTCEGVRKTVRWMQRVSAQGEVGLARAALAERQTQGQSPPGAR